MLIFFHRFEHLARGSIIRAHGKWHMCACDVIEQAFEPTNSDWANGCDRTLLCYLELRARRVASHTSKSSHVDASDRESSNLKSLIEGENSQDKSISHGDSRMVVNTGKLLFLMVIVCH